MGGVAGLIFMANLTIAIWPDHSQPNIDYQRALCAVANMTPKDVIFHVGWDYPSYLSGMGRQAVSLEGLSARIYGKQTNRQGLITEMNRIMAQARAVNGAVYWVDLSKYDAKSWDMLRLNTGLLPEDIRRYNFVPAWECSGAVIYQVK